MDQNKTFEDFFALCDTVEEIFEKEWKSAQEWEKQEKLEKEKRAIMGYEEDINFYKERIRQVLEKQLTKDSISCPPWYQTLEDGIFAELYGLAGLDPWAYDRSLEYKKSSSAKLIGEHLVVFQWYPMRFV